MPTPCNVRFSDAPFLRSYLRSRSHGSPQRYGSDKVYDMLAITTSYTDDECKEIFSTDGTAATTFWEKGKYACGKVDGNQDGSYLTMISIDGLRFGIINIVGNFGTVFVDQS